MAEKSFDARSIAEQHIGIDYAAIAARMTGETMALVLRPFLVKELTKAMAFEHTQTRAIQFDAATFAKSWKYQPPPPKNPKLDKLIALLGELDKDELARLETAARQRRTGSPAGVISPR